jgi:hypothetical protein
MAVKVNSLVLLVVVISYVSVILCEECFIQFESYNIMYNSMVTIQFLLLRYVGHHQAVLILVLVQSLSALSAFLFYWPVLTIREDCIVIYNIRSLVMHLNKYCPCPCIRP